MFPHISLNSKVVERHITLNKTQKGTDHKLSLEPNEFEQLIRQIRDIELNVTVTDQPSDDELLTTLTQYVDERELNGVKLALKPVNGKRLLECERPCQQKLGKSLVFSGDLDVGSVLKRTDMCAKVAEPFGCSAERLYDFVGRTLAKNVHADDSVDESLLEA